MKLTYRHVLVILLVLACLVGCGRDPKTRKQKYLESGDRYYAAKKYREAIIQYSNAIQVDHDFADAHYKLAKSYMEIGAWQSAMQELVTTVTAQPGNLAAQLDTGNLLLAGRDVQGALAKAELVLEREPSNADAHMLLANIHMSKGEQQPAFVEMKKAIALAPNRGSLYRNLATMQMSIKDLPGAEENFTKAAHLDPNDIRNLLALAGLYQRSQRFADAERVVQTGIAAKPDSMDIRAALVTVYLAEKKMDAAEAVLRQAKHDLPNDSAAYRSLGEYYFKLLGNLDKAAEEYALIVKAHPKDVAAQVRYAELLFAQNKFEKADEIVSRVVEGRAGGFFSSSADKVVNADAYVLRGRIALKQNKPRYAKTLFQSAVKDEPENAVAQFWLGEAASQSGSMVEAEVYWREAARLQPDMVEAQDRVATMAALKGDLPMLTQAAEQLIRLRPALPAGYIYHAAAAAGRHDYATAELDLKNVIKIAPSSALGYTRLAQLRLLQNKPAEAQSLLSDALQRDPNSVEALQASYTGYARQKQVAKGIEVVKAQIAKAPNNGGFYSLLGKVLYLSRDLPGSQQALQKAVELNPADLDAYILLGRVEAALGTLEKAKATWEASAQRSPNDPRPYLLLGMIAQSRSKAQDAQQYYEKALRLQPDNGAAAHNLANVMLENGGNTDVALSLAQTARRAFPANPVVADTLAWAYYKKRAYRSAIDLLQIAVVQTPDSPMIHYHLGLSLQAVGRADEARAHLQKALNLNPKFPHAGEAAKALGELKG